MMEKDKVVEFKMPKNVRQVGKVNGTKRIFIEDYVVSFVKKIAKEELEQCQIAILTGNIVLEDGLMNIFIDGAIKVKEVDFSDKEFVNEIWTSINEDLGKYFPSEDILGWFISEPNSLAKDNRNLNKIFNNKFNKKEDVILVYDIMEEIESFYMWENSKLVQQSGYYIYYIKNNNMQSYIIDYKNGQSSEEKEDIVINEIRSKVKKSKEKRYRYPQSFMLVATTVMSIVVLIIGGTLLYSYEQMKNIEKTLEKLSRNINEFEIGYNLPVFNNSLKEEDNISEDVNESLEVAVSNGDLKKIEEDKEEEKEKKEKKEVKNKKYIVKSGDSLATISYNIYGNYNYITKIKEINNIEDENFIIDGQVIILP